MDKNSSELLPDRVTTFYKNKTIFITGGTGFVGKVLIEKLLRVCHDLKIIYVLIRNKKQKDPKERLSNLLEGPVFNELKKQRGLEIINKIQPIVGDISLPDLGLSLEDRQKLANEVEIVYHCAATVRFDEPLKYAINLNVRGTKLLVELAKEMKNLKAFVYVSTAYSQPREKDLFEKTYEPSMAPDDAIKIAELLSDDMLKDIHRKLLKDIPNTYAFTKGLAEAVVGAEIDNLPISIQRPSIILPVLKEPLPGWTDTINGVAGILLGAGKGVIRTMYGNKDGYGDLIPVDLVINALLACTYDFVENKKRKIYNLTASGENQLTWNEIVNIGRDIIENEMPLNWVVWYPGGSMKSSKVIHTICFFLFHMLPAWFVDGILFILGQKPILTRVQRRIRKGCEVLEYYAANEWNFNKDNFEAVRKLLNDKEKKYYPLDANGIDYYTYFLNCTHSARLYLLNETDDTIPTAKRHMKVMWCVDKITKLLLTYSFVYYILYLWIYLPIFNLTVN